MKKILFRSFLTIAFLAICINPSIARFRGDAGNNILAYNSNFILLSGHTLGNCVRLVWEFCEYPYKQTVIQRSEGKEFYDIQIINKRMFLRDTSIFVFVDSFPINGQLFYRIKTEDYSGIISYSSLAALKICKSQTSIVYPIPFKRELNFITTLPEQSNITVNIRTLGGKLVSSNEVLIPGGEQITKVKLKADLVAGIYHLSLQDELGNLFYNSTIVK